MGENLITNNQSNLVAGSTNTYNFTFSGTVDMNNVDIGLSSATVWFSWPNISPTNSNNTYSIIHPTLAGTTTLNITIPTGGYDITTLNDQLRYYLITNGYYIQNNTSGDQTVYAAFQVNPTLYCAEFISYPLPTALPAGYTAGSAITFPAVSTGPQLVVGSVGFGTVIGFAVGTFPASPPTVTTAVISTLVPKVSNVQNVLLTLDSANNPYARNSGIIHAISPAGVPYASLITSKPSQICFVPQSGIRQSITLRLTDQNLVPLNLLDTDITVVLFIRDKLIR